MSGNPTREETEEITSIWQTGLWNSHIQADRFLLEDDRAIFMFKVKHISDRIVEFKYFLCPGGFNSKLFLNVAIRVVRILSLLSITLQISILLSIVQ